jgi:hypothetical protein
MVQLIPPVTNRPPYYDRTPLAVTIFNTTTDTAPAGSTVRATYTVPTNRKAFVTHGTLQTIRVTAATTSARAEEYAVLAGLIAAIASIENNAVGTQASIGFGSGYVVLAGQVVQLTTNDGSTAGTLTFVGALGILEFDA